MTKPIIKKQTNFSPLYTLLINKGYTLLDLKCEVSLMFCGVLFDLYLLSEKEGKSQTLIENSNSEEGYIFKTIEELNKKIKSAIVDINTIEKIFQKQKVGDSSSINLAKIHQPYKKLYNQMITAYLSKKEDYLNEDSSGKKYWMPELLALNIIANMKEKGYNYDKFPFVDDSIFFDLEDRYIKTNRILQQTHDFKVKSNNLNELSIISKTRIFAQFISKKLIEAKAK
jgi:hypothetical protein